MAVRATRQPTSRISQFEPVHLDLISRSRLRERLWNCLPLGISLLIVSTIFWAPFYAPEILAVSLVAFFAYWLIRSYAVVVACVVGIFRIRRWKATNWAAKYCAWLPGHPGAETWDWPRHLVIIPNYRESEEGLSRTLDSLAAQPNRDQLVVVLAMEARETGCRAKAGRLLMRYRVYFGDMFATYHPAGLPSETPGKGSNEAWAAREAYRRLIDDGAEDIRRFTVTSCDADAVFHERHFEALNYLFLTSKDRYRAFWQPTIFNSNNIWDIPAPLRIPDGLSGVNRLSNLLLPGSVKFPTSCYSLSWEMLHAIDYWDEEVIPEDWHVYLKSCFTLGDRVHVEPIFLPLGNDCVLTDRYDKTIRAHYAQQVRHAWGASDIPYAWRFSLNRRSPLSWRRRLVLTGAVTKVHALWMAQWYIVALGPQIPVLFTRKFGAGMPPWWTTPSISLPGPMWDFGALFTGHFFEVLEIRWLMLAIVPAMISVCLLPLLGIIALEYYFRGPRPEYVRLRHVAWGFAQWPLMAANTFLLGSVPALHAQWKLASGNNLVYRVAEKGSRRMPHPHLPALGNPAKPQEKVRESMSIGGGQ
ncbi:MAG: glycosyltransferase family 2 protein [Hyphomicrobiales bacterium]